MKGMIAWPGDPWGIASKSASEAKSMGYVRTDQGTVVILAHGLGRTTRSFGPMAEYLESARPLGKSFRFGYASTRRPVADHAQALASVIQRVGTGGPHHPSWWVTAWATLSFATTLGTPESNPDPRLGRCVMIGPPEPWLAHGTGPVPNPPLFPLITGPSGVDLGQGLESNWKGIWRSRPVSLGSSRGGGPTIDRGWNPLCLRGPAMARSGWKKPCCLEVQ